jgi:UDP-N-acetylmuramate--alanine ligase
MDEGIDIHFEENVSLIDKSASIVVYTPAVPKTHQELNYYIDNNFEVVKRSDVLGMITKNSFNICVAGTHGKTTTSAMVAHILKHSGHGCNAFLGGIATNYKSNFWSSDNNVSVVEADEYDRSFLKLHPDVAIITSMDPDHLDIYGTEANMQDAFIEFTTGMKADGLLIQKLGLARESELKAPRKLTYSIEDNGADIFAGPIKINNGSYTFDVHIQNYVLKDVVLNMGGKHNIENTLAAIAVARDLKIEDELVRAAVASFQGVKRRFEYILKNEQQVLIDDYAHHPEELRALISGTKSLFPKLKCSIIFQPHLFSRTRDLANDFANVLTLADETVILPIYPARELPIEGVSSEMILDKMGNNSHSVKSKEEVLKWVKKERPSLLITAGAGDIDVLVEPIKNILLEK